MPRRPGPQFGTLAFLDQVPTQSVHGGSKAKADARIILQRLGARSIPIGGRSRMASARRLLQAAWFSFFAPRTTVLAHFPAYNRTLQLMCRMMGLRHRLAFLIHDIDQARHV